MSIIIIANTTNHIIRGKDTKKTTTHKIKLIYFLKLLIDDTGRYQYYKKHPASVVSVRMLAIYVSGYLIELEVTAGIVIADILYHTRENLMIVGQQTLLNVVTKHITEYTTEILVTWIAEERAAVSKHTHET